MKISSSCKMFAIVALLAAGVGLSTTSVSARAPQVQSATSTPYTVKASIAGAKNKTVLLVAKTGRVLASKKITSDTATAVTLTTPSGKSKITTLAGATLQLVSSTSGDYFGPVVLGWKGTKLTSAIGVYTKFSSSATTNIVLGTITVKNVSASNKQGYGYTAISSSQVDKTTASTTKATKGVPKGVGTYGKATTASASALFVTGNRSPMFCPPTCPGPPAEGGGGGAKVDVDDLDGGDADDDGIPNAFDVNDDGDSKVDSADSVTPEPDVSGTSIDAATCEAAASFHIFTNYKATENNFTDTLNFYGTGSHEATDASIFTQVGKSMSMVFSPITKVCGETVKKMEIKGVGVSYAPTAYAEVTAGSTGDIQWRIGEGKLNQESAVATGFSAQTFTTRDSLPSGQDTFMQRVTTTSDKVYEFTATAGFVFVTHPMLQGYCVKTTADTTSCVSGSDFTQINYAASSIPTISVASTETLVLRMYRPQRFAIDGEPSGLYNLGGFKYTPDMPNPPGGRTDGNNFGKCDAATYTDAEMKTDTLASSSDSAPTSTLQASWDLQACFDAKVGKSWSTGTVTIDIQVEPSGPGGNSAQKLFLTLT
ncbi:MAG: hypothetical protein F2956_09260 [Actinobacteria bacterium]|nr:hypothetical protein [Actinomycetota bacterium]